MKKGFIESIDEKVIYVKYDDSYEFLNLENYPHARIDMIVENENGHYNFLLPDENLKKQIKEITKRTFKSFKDKNKK